MVETTFVVFFYQFHAFLFRAQPLQAALLSDTNDIVEAQMQVICLTVQLRLIYKWYSCIHTLSKMYNLFVCFGSVFEIPS